MGDGGLKSRLVLVVHGIGEQQPGETVDLLVGGLTGDRPCDIGAEQRRLHEPKTPWSDKPEDAELFQCDLRSVVHDGGQTDFAEVYWGDLSRGFDGRLRGIIELFTLVMGLGHIVRENMAEKGGHHLRALLARLFVSLLHGPIVAVNLAIGGCVVALVLWNALLSVTTDNHTTWGGWVPDLAMLSTALGLISFWLLRREDRSSHLYTSFLNGLAAMAAILVAVVLGTWIFTPGWPPEVSAQWLGRVGVNLDPNAPSCRLLDQSGLGDCLLLWYTHILIYISGFCWFVAIASVLALGLIQAGIDLTRYFRSGPRDFLRTLYPSTCAFVMVIWLFMALAVWATVIEFFERFQPDAEEPGAVPTPPTPSAGPSADLKEAPTPTEHLLAIPEAILTDSFRDAVSLAAAISVAMGILLAFCTAIGLHRWIKLWWHRRQEGDTLTYQPPRLIISTALRVGLTVCVFLLAFSAFVEALIVTGVVSGGWVKGVHDYLQGNVFKIGLLAAAGAAAVFTIFRTYIGIGLGIAKDVVVWFIKSENTDRAEETLYPMRQRILNRFDMVFKTMLLAKPYDEVVVVSHSQGTLVAFQALRRNRLGEQMGDRYCVPDLITMGSPISHIYGHYFARSFDPGDGDKPGIGNWVNIYRTDDFVGTTVKTTEIDGQNWPRNIAIPAGGHTNYWTDLHALVHLRAHATPEFPATLPPPLPSAPRGGAQPAPGLGDQPLNA